MYIFNTAVEGRDKSNFSPDEHNFKKDTQTVFSLPNSIDMPAIIHLESKFIPEMNPSDDPNMGHIHTSNIATIINPDRNSPVAFLSFDHMENTTHSTAKGFISNAFSMGAQPLSAVSLRLFPRSKDGTKNLEQLLNKQVTSNFDEGRFSRRGYYRPHTDFIEKHTTTDESNIEEFGFTVMIMYDHQVTQQATDAISQLIDSNILSTDPSINASFAKILENLIQPKTLDMDTDHLNIDHLNIDHLNLDQ